MIFWPQCDNRSGFDSKALAAKHLAERRDTEEAFGGKARAFVDLLQEKNFSCDSQGMSRTKNVWLSQEEQHLVDRFESDKFECLQIYRFLLCFEFSSLFFLKIFLRFQQKVKIGSKLWIIESKIQISRESLKQLKQLIQSPAICILCKTSRHWKASREAVWVTMIHVKHVLPSSLFEFIYHRVVSRSTLYLFQDSLYRFCTFARRLRFCFVCF